MGCAVQCTRAPAIWGAPSNPKEPQQSEGFPTIWGAPSIGGASSNLRSPSNLRGPQQSKGPSAIWRTPDNLRGCIYLNGPSNLRGPINQRSLQQSEGPAIWGPQQSEGLSTIWACPERPYQPEGPPAIWGSSNLTAPGNLRGPQQLRVGPLRAVVISLKLSSNAVNEVNHLRNCSAAWWLYYALSSTLSDVCSAPHVVADVASDIRTIIFKIEAHQKLYE